MVPRHGRKGATPVGRRPFSWLAASLVLVLPSAGLALEPAWSADAALHDVAVVDAQTAWAVGDRGVIWHTADGGQTWTLQKSGVSCTLNCIEFVDRQHGWAAGGSSRPHSRLSTGALLHTQDGGQTWQTLPQPILPLVTALKFFNASEGWALGIATPDLAAGLFVTQDGGRSWAPVSGTDVREWQTADFVNARFGALAGTQGQLSIVRRQAIEPAESPPLGLRRVHALRIAPDSTGWLAGDSGLLLATADSGRHWKPPSATLPESFEGWAVAARGWQVWVAGSPGSVVWHTADAGQSWLAQPTGSLVPIRAIEFADPEHGWTVGSLGTILHTADGGRSWQRQHGGGTRAAWLGLFSDSRSVPLELVGELSAHEGHLGVVDFLTRTDLEPGGSEYANCEPRDREAVLLAGASDGEQAGGFPVRQAGLVLPAEQVLATWNRAAAGQGIARLETHLVREIRTWRPDIVVTHAPSPRGDDPLGHAINQAVLRAVEAAARPTPETELETRLQLEPWQVQKVFAAAPAGHPAALTLSATQLVPALGCTLADVADRGRALLNSEPQLSAAKLGFRLLIDRAGPGAGGHDFFGGIARSASGEARRPAHSSTDQADDLLRRSGQRLRNLQAILAYMERKNVSHDQLLAELGNWVGDLEPDVAAELLYKLARQYQLAGRWDLAVEVMNLVVARYAEHALAEPALVWLIWARSSSEIANHAQSLANPPGLISGGTVQSDGAAAPNTPSIGSREQQALALARLLQQHSLAAYADPAVQLPLAAIERRQIPPSEAEKRYRNFLSVRPHDAFWNCASAGLWLLEPRDACPKPVCQVHSVASKPRLDGKLDDATWQRAQSIDLHSAAGDDGDWPARVMFVADQEYLYLAVECREAPGCRYDRSSATRPRDPDLSDRDRVEVFIDLDCDWATYFRLAIDYRGWAAEDCCHDPTWNPHWFVAADQHAGTWTVEAALPLAALAAKRPKPKDAWAIGVQRIAPQAGFQSWTTPAAVDPVPEGFGLLIFD